MVTIYFRLTEIYARLSLVTMNFAPQIDDLEMLTLVHSREHVENIRELCEETEEESAQNYDSIYFNGEVSCNFIVILQCLFKLTYNFRTLTTVL